MDFKVSLVPPAGITASGLRAYIREAIVTRPGKLQSDAPVAHNTRHTPARMKDLIDYVNGDGGLFWAREVMVYFKLNMIDYITDAQITFALAYRHLFKQPQPHTVVSKSQSDLFK